MLEGDTRTLLGLTDIFIIMIVVLISWGCTEGQTYQMA